MPEPSSKSPHPPLRIHASGATEMGRGRVHNDDMVLLRPDLGLYAVADGAGVSGNVASAVAIASIANYFEATERGFSAKPDIDGFGFSSGGRRLASAIQKANRDISELAAGSKQHRRMGATLVAMSFSTDVGLLHVASVGDSRCYRFRAGQLEQLTDDHSLIQDAVALRPDIDDDELARLPSNVVTRTLGTKDGLRVRSRTLQIVDGDKYLLCSDGLSDVLEEDVIRSALASQKAPGDLVARLIRAASERGGDDNIAAIAVVCELSTTKALAAIRRAPRVVPVPGSERSGGDRATDLGSDDYILDEDPTVDRAGRQALGKTAVMPGAPAKK